MPPGGKTGKGVDHAPRDQPYTVLLSVRGQNTSFLQGPSLYQQQEVQEAPFYMPTKVGPTHQQEDSSAKNLLTSIYQ